MTSNTDADGAPAAEFETWLMGRLEALRARRAEDPTFNPVWHLACELSFKLERGEIARETICRLGDRLLARSLDDRGAWMGDMLGPLEAEANLERLSALVTEEAGSQEFETFAAGWQRPVLGCVFTGHPTFLLGETGTARVIAALMGETAPQSAECAAEAGSDRAITLAEEHGLALNALANARAANRRLTRHVLAAACKAYPRDWTRLCPAPVDLASWVGYDMDGRTDIGWDDCIRLRLIEKRTQLDWYLADLAPIEARAQAQDEALETGLAKLRGTLEAARSHTERAIALFCENLGEPANLKAAADWLTGDRPGRLTHLAPLIARLDELIAAASGDLALDLATLKAQMVNFRLGVGRIHFRINATQLHNAVRRRLNSEEAVDLASRTALVQLNELAEGVAPVAVNFAALATETATAMRQTIAIAQIRKHIDSEADIRLLIAETERPATVLSAVYLASLFGVAGCIDISPLFETAPALEAGERFLDVLFSQPAYRAAVEARGRIAVQTGFSDAGRFIGQIPAALAIERLQANVARLMDRHGLGHLECVIFNTHGESMGRGGHPTSIAARLDHALSPWARAQFAKRGLRLRPEASFQGGDGYLWFAREATALALLTRLLEHDRRLDESGATAAAEDPLYGTPEISLDFYRRMMRFQQEVMALPAYHRTLTAFAPALLKTTGSRKSRRQFESGGGERADLAKIRAIPHNAALQQLGFPLNVVSGVGQATRAGREPFTDWRQASPRFAALLDMVVEGRRRASLRSMVAYGSLFDPSYWATRPHGAGQGHLTEACLYLADRLEGDQRYQATLELAARLRTDELLLHRLLGETGEDTAVMEAKERDFLVLLHALRIALIEHLFLLAARIPRFSARNDISREDIMELIFELRVPEAVVQLRAAYPEGAPATEDLALEEPADYPDAAAPDYGALNRRLIDPMETVHRCLLTISVAVANAWHAHG